MTAMAAGHVLGAIALAAAVAATTGAAAATNPFDAFEQMLAPPRWHHPHHPLRSRARAAVPAAAVPAGSATEMAAATPPAGMSPPLPAPRPAAAGEGVAAASAAAGGPPLPAQRPPAADAPAAADAAVTPLPPPRPAAPPSTEAMVAAPAPAAPIRLASLPPPAETLAEKPAAAFGALAALGVKSIPVPAIEEGRCTVLDPVSISALESGAVALSEKAILNDRMAEAFARWVHDDVMPAAEGVLSGKLTGIRVVGSYSCRPRTDRPAAGRMSEHGFANAVDVAGFRIDKRWVEVGGDKHNAADDARFLDTIRHAACRRFTTVLGPGQPDHDTHFHLDLAQRTGHYAICE